MPTWNWKRPWIYLLGLIILAGCQTSPLPDLDAQNLTEPVVSLDRERAAVGEEVRAEIIGLDADTPALNLDDMEVTVAGIEAHVEAVEALAFEFVVPEGTPEGPQPVEVDLGVQTLLATLNVLGSGNAPDGLIPDLPTPGDDAPTEFVLIVEPGTTADELTRLLKPLVVNVLEGPRPLGLAEGPCSGDLVKIEVAGIDVDGVIEGIVDIGDVLAILNKLEVEGSVWYSDPESGYDSGTINHLAAVGAVQGQAPHAENAQTGVKTVVSVLDTGVSSHGELGSRLLSGIGYDFADEDEDAADDYGDGGHGTPIAVLAAGSSAGVAPQAQILPVRVCDENGTCYTSDITLGLCHALATAEEDLNGMENLVLNLSFGGETPNTAIEAILAYALQNGTLVAASGGNGRQEGSPPHYPAAYDMEGMVATAAVGATGSSESEGGWHPASFSTRGDYLDIAAPGVDLVSGTSSGDYGSDFTGTSFATAQTAGALALLREANPGMSPAGVEEALKAAARTLPFPESEVGAGLLPVSGMTE